MAKKSPREALKKLLREEGYQKPEDLLRKIVAFQAAEPDFLHENTAAAMKKRRLLASLLKENGIRRIRFLEEGADSVIFEINENQIVRAWTKNEPFRLEELSEMHQDSRILQPILVEQAGSVDTPHYGAFRFGILAKPKVATEKTVKAAKRAYARALKADAPDWHDFLPKWVKKDLEFLRIPGMDEDLEPTNYGHMKNGKPVQFDTLGRSTEAPDGNIEEQKALYPQILTGRIAGGITAGDLTALEKNLGHKEAAPFARALQEEGLYLHGGFNTVNGNGPIYRGLDTVLGEATERLLKERTTGSEHPLAQHVDEVVTQRQKKPERRR